MRSYLVLLFNLAFATIARSFVLPILSGQIVTSPISVSTPLGLALGANTADGAVKFVMRYAIAPVRWSAPVVEKVVAPANLADVSAMPPMCPQPGVDPSSYSEDCLFTVLYVPPNTRPSASLPMLVWIHGGSNLMGSASDPGLDGSKLALATDSIVAVVQYRLGALGFLPPSTPGAASNLAIRDLISALEFLHTVGPAFGGSTARVTLAGQSSGAGLIKALLATPSASQYFAHAWLHSDPMNYGILPPSSLTPYAQAFYSSLPNPPELASLSDVLDAQSNTLYNLESPFDLPGIAMPLRPIIDGSLIQYSLLPDGTSYTPSSRTLPPSLKPIVLTTVSAEAAPGDFSNPAFSSPLPYDTFLPILEGVLSEPRAGLVVNSTYYAFPGAATDPNGGDVRSMCVEVGTDYIWRCANDALARDWAANGGKVYVGEFQLGATYPNNADISYCTESPTQVCHQDDIYIVFGTAPSPTSAQTVLSNAIQARYKDLLWKGVPGSDWVGVQGDVVSARILGGPQDGQALPQDACVESFWGEQVPFDFQVYSQ